MSNKRILVAVPAYNCAAQIPRVIRQFETSRNDAFNELIVIDNCSNDNTLKTAVEVISARPDLRMSVLRNDENYGLGGTHKVAFQYALKNNFDGIVILHGDDQGQLSDLAPAISTPMLSETDCVLGARFMKGSRRVGYSGLRVFGNYAFNYLYTLSTSHKIFDMGSGLNYFERSLFLDSLCIRMPDDLTFNNAYLLALVASGKRIRFAPISWREEDQVSNAKLWTQSRKLLEYLSLFVFDRSRLLSDDFREVKREEYKFSVVASTFR
jgi:glycosyltransferase involved in cell wall biosynthesis